MACAKYILLDKYKDSIFDDMAEIVEPLIELTQEYHQQITDPRVQAKVDQVDFSRPEVHLCVGNTTTAVDSLSGIIEDLNSNLTPTLSIQVIMCFPVNWIDESELSVGDTGYEALRNTSTIFYLRSEFERIKSEHPNNMFSKLDFYGHHLGWNSFNFITEAGAKAEPKYWLMISVPLCTELPEGSYTICN